MPRATASRPFEWLLFGWAQALRGGDGFLVLLDQAGAIARVHDADTVSFGNRCVAHATKDALTPRAPRWIYFDPFDAPEYSWLTWEAVPGALWGPLLRETLAAGELRVAGDVNALLAAIPASWGVMF